MRAKAGLVGLIASLLILTSAIPALAQEAESQTITTPYPGVLVEPGDTASFTLAVNSDTTRSFELVVEGLPEGWSPALRGGGQDIRRATAGPGTPASVDLDVTVPLGTEDGAYPFTVEARAGSTTAIVELEVVVATGAGGEVVLTPEFPGLRGPSDATFTFSVEVDNQTAEEVQLELEATGPRGWRVDARPAAENQASTLAVDAGSRQRVTVEANPPITVEAGEYEVTLRVTGAGIEQELPLGVQITGDVALEISTPDQRLNSSVTAGEPSVIPIVVFNSGTAPLNGIDLRATTPRDWEATFQPEAITSLAAGESTTVEATVTPSADALAGDYRVTFRASVDQAQDSVEIRTTVEPSTLWGLIGVGVIALTLGGLAGVFRRFGRR